MPPPNPLCAELSAGSQEGYSYATTLGTPPCLTVELTVTHPGNLRSVLGQLSPVPMAKNCVAPKANSPRLRSPSYSCQPCAGAGRAAGPACRPRGRQLAFSMRHLGVRCGCGEGRGTRQQVDGVSLLTLFRMHVPSRSRPSKKWGLC